MPTAVDDRQAARRWPRWLSDRFNLLGPVSVWAAGPLDPVSVTIHKPDGTRQAFGSNRPVRPVRFGTSGSFADTVTHRVDQDPFVGQQLLARVWVLDQSKALSLQAALIDKFWSANRADGLPLLRKGYVDIAGSVAGISLPVAMLATAQDIIVEAWSDDALIHFLTREHERARARQTRILGR